MNGKQSKRLKSMRRCSKKSKRIFNRLTHIEKGKLTARIKDDHKLIPTDLLSMFE